MNLEIKKITKGAKIPVRAHNSDSGLDLYSSISVEILAGTRMKVATGIAMKIPEGYAGLIWDKSGLSFEWGLKVIGGVIDSGYRGEIIVSILNTSSDTYVVKKGQKIAQILIQKVEIPKLIEVLELSDTERGSKGFGSTGI